MTVWVYLENITKVFDANFFFVNGSSHGNQGIGTSGTFYVFEFPLFLLGIINMFMKKWKSSFFAVWGVIAFLVLALSKEVPHATRGYFLLIPVTIICAAGLVFGLELIKRIDKNIRLVILSGFLLFIVYNVIYYFSSYFIRFPIAYAKDWRQQDSNLVSYIRENEDKYDRIIFDSKTDFIYTSYLFYAKYPPIDFYSTVKRAADDSEGFSKVQSFGKFEFRDIDWTKDPKQSRTLIVTTPSNKPNEMPPLKTFYFPTRPVVVSLKEQIFEYPVTDIPYVLVEGKL